MHPESEYEDGGWTAPRPFVAILDEAASLSGVDIRWLSDDWIARLEKNGVVHYTHGASFPLNNAGSALIAADKVATYTVLSDARLPSVPHHLVRFRSSGGSAGATDKVLAGLSAPLVVKPIAEAGGLDVCRAETIEEARTTIARLAQRYLALAVSPFEDVRDEYRVVVLDDAPLLFYRKVFPHPAVAAGEWRRNLKHGTRPVVEESRAVRAELADLAIKAVRAVDGRFMAVDMIRTPETLKVLEINSGVTLDRFAGADAGHRSTAVRIYRDALNRLFL